MGTSTGENIQILAHLYSDNVEASSQRKRSRDAKADGLLFKG